MSNNTKLLCLFLKAQKTDKSSEQGYAMALVSLMTIILLSLLAGAYVFSNLARSRTDAFVDSHSSFSVAESGLHKRANEFKTKLTNNYSGVSGIVTSTEDRGLGDCFGIGISTVATATATDDFECRNYSFKTKNTTSHINENNSISFNAGENADGTDRSPTNYIAYTRVSAKSVQPIVIPTNDDYAGLNASEYKYVLYSTAKKPTGLNADGSLAGGGDLPVYTVAEIAAKNRQLQNQTAFTGDDTLITSYDDKKTAATSTTAFTTASRAAGGSNSNISLSMTFTNRVIPLFQFGIFYNGDLEFNSTSPMDVKGWVHSNANIYAQPAGETALPNASTTTFLSKVSAVGSIYNRVDAWAPGIGRTGITRVLLTGNDCSVASNCLNIPAFVTGTTTPLSTTDIATFNGKLQSGIARLKTPAPSFFRKRSYATNADGRNTIGEYYAKADMRLDFVPNRDTASTAVIPFNFTAIRTAGAGTCTTTAPVVNTDPGANYIDPKREGTSLKCNPLTKGQLQSLRQPVLVLTKLNQTTALATQENNTLGRPTLPAVPTLTTLNNTEANKNKLLRALQVALVSTPDPISLDRLNTAFNVMDTTDPALNAFRTEFIRLLDVVFPTPTGVLTAAQAANRDDKLALVGFTPNQVAALQGAWFLPAPIQRVTTRTNPDSTNNPRNSGFYDGREQRWISVLQTNIASLSVWNRDGLYVKSNDNDDPTLTVEKLRTAYTSTTGNRDLSFNSGSGANFTAGLAFDRDTAPTTAAKGLQPLGLGSIDSTEGGLIIHASVNDDLNGSGGAIDTTNDITKDTANPITETTTVSGVTTTTTVDYLRKYPGVTPIKKSPFAFAFTGGDYLPNSLLLASDQAVYLQGNFNNNGNRNIDGSLSAIPLTAANTPSDARLSASVIADTITVLSNECVAVNPTTVTLTGVPAGQLKCGIQTGSNLVGSPMVVNAAFLSNTDASNGNYHVGETLPALTERRYSGGVNNYIRLLEDWNNAGIPYALNYTGSLISLGTPLEYSGQYRPGGVTASALGVTPVVLASYYNIPFRSFNYDSNFSSVDKMPPLTPKANYIQQKNFSQAR